eukprot:TRINITY_DN6298_c0_g1_i3.p1 TRINITY_DN6298_c0_g1~~TRINITY_DN6298_c0_g1_i3.p1  ORF type:complete len:442 (+),score=82.89 TRINITY_DN6298_c0_g1_i3:38-1327(+)
MSSSKALPFTLAAVRKAVETHPTPFHLYGENAIRQNARKMTAAYKQHFPGYKNYFAVKATPNATLLRILREEGMGADCSSLAELHLSHHVGFHGEDIMFTSNNTQAEEYKKAHSLGAIINLDDITQIPYLQEALGGTLPNLVCLRYNPGPLKKGNAIIGEPEQAKFGFTRKQLFEGYEILKKNGVTRFGLHCMVASNELDITYFAETARLLFELVNEISSSVGITFEFVNMGGGIGIPYRPGQTAVDYTELTAKIHELYTEIIGKDSTLRIVTECGRVITGPYGLLVTKVLHHKDTYKKYVGVDGCMANLMRPGMYGAYHHVTVVDTHSPLGWEAKSGPTSPTDVVGSLCENNDKFAVDRELPQALRDDIVIVHDAGAHGHSMGFNYNGKLRSAELLLTEDGDIKVIRRAETYDDLFATLELGKSFHNQ